MNRRRGAAHTTPARPRERSSWGRLIPFRRKREPEAALDIDALYRQHAGMILRRAQRFFKDEDEAQEIMHDVFMRAIEKQHTFRADASPSTWLYQMATNLCLNRLRDSKRRAQKLEINAELPWILPSAARDQEATLLLSQLIGQLDDESLAIGTYYFVDGMTHAEIARIMGVSRRTIGNRIDDLRASARRAAGMA